MQFYSVVHYGYIYYIGAYDRMMLARVATCYSHVLGWHVLYL